MPKVADPLRRGRKRWLDKGCTESALPQPARAGAPPARSVTPEGGGCKAAGTRLSGVSLNGDPTQSGETPDDRGPARSAPRSPE
jgi:hypothetical protein